MGDKFGCDAEMDAPGLLRLAKELGLDVIGVSFHVGTFCLDNEAHATGIELSRKIFDYGKSIGFDFTILDIGGGFPGDTDTSIVKVFFFFLLNFIDTKFFKFIDIKSNK